MVAMSLLSVSKDSSGVHWTRLQLHLLRSSIHGLLRVAVGVYTGFNAYQRVWFVELWGGREKHRERVGRRETNRERRERE
jgi:hypothetical protein